MLFMPAAFRGLGHGPYTETLRAFSVMMQQEKVEVDQGGKVILPSSSLEKLTHLNIPSPMLFKLYAPTTHKTTHVGVLEFTAHPGTMLLPSWLMRHLTLEEGAPVSISSIQLPTATFSKFKPLQHEFLDITNPKAVLEQVLRFFACLTKGDVIAVHYNSKVYEMLVVECRPDDAVSIIECDMQVDFETPDGYGMSSTQVASASGVSSSLPSSSSLLTPVGRDRLPTSGETALEDENEKLMVHVSSLPSRGFEAFSGSGRRLGGPKKARKTDIVLPETPEHVDVYSLNQRGIPNYNWRPGTITFRRIRRRNTSTSSGGKSLEAEFSPFGGAGNVLKRPKQDQRFNSPRP